MKKKKEKKLVISEMVVASSRRKRKPTVLAARNVFEPLAPPPGVVPDGVPTMAMDDSISAASSWAGNYPAWAFSEGQAFLGYPYLAELSQRPEYRRLVELIATECTRKWIKLTGKGEADKKNKISKINDELVRLNAQGACRKILEQDGFFGRSHLFIDLGVDSKDEEELITPIGNGDDNASKSKVKKGSLKALKTVEAVWTYPTNYNSSDPLADDWYAPTIWYVMGKRVHSTRLLTFVGREVPDLLKPAYSFGGLALTQMVKPYVDNWLKTRQSVSDIISSFVTYVLKTNLAESLSPGGEQLFRRAELFNNTRDNAGLMLLDKETEDFANVAAPLSSLDLLQAQSQEHICSVSGTPVVKYLGIQPAGLNASSEGELKTWYDWVKSYQNSMLRDHVTRILNFIQLSLFGKVDPDIVFDFEPLEELSALELAQLQDTKAKTGVALIDGGIIDAEEERERIRTDPESSYQNLTGPPPDLREEEEEGLEPIGGRPDPLAETPEAEELDEGARDSLILFDALALDEAKWEESKHPRGQPDNAGQFGPGGGGNSMSSSKEDDDDDDSGESESTSEEPLPGSFKAAKKKILALSTPDRKKAYQAMHELFGNEGLSPGTFKKTMKALKAPLTQKKELAKKLNDLLEHTIKEGKWVGSPNQEPPKESAKPEPEKISKSPSAQLNDTAKEKGFEYYSLNGEWAIYKKGQQTLSAKSDGSWHLLSPPHMPKQGPNAAALEALLNGDKDKWQKLGVTNASSSPTIEPAKSSEPHATPEHAKVLKAVALARPGPTSEQNEAINSYKGSGYVSMNNALRLKGHHTPRTKKLESWLDKASLPQDVVAYRGISGDHVDALKSMLFKGMIYRDRGFVSCSTNEQFAANWKGGEKSAVIKINMPKGYKAAAIRPHTHGDNEFEIVIQCGMYYKVKSYNHKTRRIEVDAIEGPAEDLGPEKDE